MKPQTCDNIFKISLQKLVLTVKINIGYHIIISFGLLLCFVMSLQYFLGCFSILCHNCMLSYAPPVSIPTTSHYSITYQATLYLFPPPICLTHF
jgi:hypothetical protein